MEKKLNNVIPECYIDTLLTGFLLNAKVNHQHSCNNVVKTLNNKFKDEFAIGIIDNDKRRVKYIENCDEILKTKRLTLFKHRDRCQFLVALSPAADGFIFDCAKEEGVNLSDFDLPTEFEDFLKQTKSKELELSKDKRFKNLFKEIKNNKDISLLKNILNYLCENQYKSNMNELKNEIAK